MIKQLFRGIIELGIVRFILLLGPFSAILLFLFNYSAKEKESYYLIYGFLFILLIIQTRRKEKGKTIIFKN